MLDLYCGSGLFSLPIAKSGRGGDGDGGESPGDRAMRKPMSASIAAAGADPIHGGASRGRAWRGSRKDPWDAVVLDPPRQGCPPAVIAGVFERIRPARVVYVSCSPDALAKELPVILKTGYRVTRVQPVDMFPHTDHIETVMAFERE